MKKIEEQICYWYEASRKDVRIINYEKQGCYICRGKNKECNKYFDMINTYLMRQNTSAYEEGHAGYKKRK